MKQGDTRAEIGGSTGLGKRITRLLDLYPSRAAAAEAGRISTDQLRDYERDRAHPRFEVLVRLAAPYDVSLEWLASGVGLMFRTERTAAASTFPEGIRQEIPRTQITPELIRVVTLYWLLANMLATPRTDEELAETIANQCKLMAGDEEAVHLFVEHLKSNISDMRDGRDAAGKL